MPARLPKHGVHSTSATLIRVAKPVQNPSKSTKIEEYRRGYCPFFTNKIIIIMCTKSAETRASIALVVYISHPVAGEIEENLAEVREIVQFLLYTAPNVIPVAPYYFTLATNNEWNNALLQKAKQDSLYLLGQGFINELWLYGGTINKDMSHEIIVAMLRGITVVPKTAETAREYNKTFAHVKPAELL